MAKRTGNKNGGAVWRGREYTHALMKVESKRLDTAARELSVDIKRRFPGSGIANATAAQRRAHASAPGEIPHVQTSFLRDNVEWDRTSQLNRRVGTGIGGAQSVPYAASLEKGNNRGLAKRPYLRPALKRNKRQILKTVGGRFRGKLLRGKVTI